MSTQVRFTTDDLDVFPLEDGTRYEIIDGVLHVSKQPDWQHQFIGDTISGQLRNWDPRREFGIAVPAPGLIFAPDQAVAPDLVWIRRERFARVIGSDNKLHLAPDLVVEILSPGRENERRDREAKLQVYSLYGVVEYWILDWHEQTLQVYRRENAALRLAATLRADDTVDSPLLPGFSCTLRDICQLP